MADYLPKDKKMASVTPIAQRELSGEVEMDAVPEQSSTMTERLSSEKTDDDKMLSESDSMSTASDTTIEGKFSIFRPIIICDEEDEAEAETFKECLNDIHVANGQIKAEVFGALPGELHFESLDRALQTSTHKFLFLTTSFCKKETLLNEFQSHVALHTMLDSEERKYNLIPVHTEKEECRQYDVPAFIRVNALATVFYSREERKIDKRDITKLKKMFEKKEQLQDEDLRKQSSVQSCYKTTTCKAAKEERVIPGERSTVFSVSPNDSGLFQDKFGVSNTVKDARAISTMAKSICLISGPDGEGTGFRVGSAYVLTTASVVQSLASNKGMTVHNYVAYFDLLEECEKTEGRKFLFKRQVYFSSELDAAILELEANKALPPCFEHFSPPDYNKHFYFVGHHETVLMHDLVTKTVPLSQVNTKCLQELDSKSLTFYELRYDNTKTLSDVFDKNRMLFLCRYRNRARGSPGVWIDGKNYVVTTMLQGGFPRWYYDDQMLDWKPSECVEQGLNMNSLYQDLQRTDIQLCEDIFRKAKYMEVSFSPSTSVTTGENNWVYGCKIL